MAINPQNAFLQLSPMKGLSPIGPITADKDNDEYRKQQLEMQRQQLQLQRQQFSEQTRQNREDERIRTLNVNAQKAGKALEEQRLAEENRQKQLQYRQGRAAEFAKLNAAGDIVGARMMLPELQSNGTQVEQIDEVNGIPVYKIDIDPEATAAARERELDQQTGLSISGDEVGAAGIGYKGEVPPEAGPPDAEGDPTAPLSTEDAFARAQASTASFEATGEPTRGPDRADVMSAIPDKVLDVPAMYASNRLRGGPLFEDIAQSYPGDERTQASVRHTAAAAVNSGLSPTAQLDAFKALRSGPDSFIKAEIESQQKLASEQREKPLTRNQLDALQNSGRDKINVGADKRGVRESLNRFRLADGVVGILRDPQADANASLFMLVDLLHSRGPQSNSDLAMLVGSQGLSAKDQIKDRIEKFLKGGMGTAKKDKLLKAVQSLRAEDEKEFFDWAETTQSQIESEGRDPDVRKGMEEAFANLVPSEYARQLDERRKAKKSTGAGAPPAATAPAPAPKPGSWDAKGAAVGDAASDAGALGPDVPLPPPPTGGSALSEERKRQLREKAGR